MQTVLSKLFVGIDRRSMAGLGLLWLSPQNLHSKTSVGIDRISIRTAGLRLERRYHGLGRREHVGSDRISTAGLRRREKDIRESLHSVGGRK